MATYTESNGSQSTFTVPENVTELVIECWGAAGGTGKTVNQGKDGGLGGYTKGTLSVTEGQTLTVVAGGQGEDGDTSGDDASGGFPNGGDGEHNGGNNVESASGAGGGSSHVMRGGTTQSDVVILAGGAGGGASAENDDTVTTAGAAGNGGTADDASDGFDTASGGVGGAAADWNGEKGSDSQDDDDFSYASGGGGGGGYNGGGGGSAIAKNQTSLAAGGGAGDAYTADVTNVTTTNAVQSGGGQVTITYDAKPADPSGLSASVDKDVNVALSWTDNSTIEDEFEVYKDTTSGVDTNSTLLGTTGANTTTISESFSSNVDQYYNVRAVNGATPSNFANEIRVQAGVVQYYDGANWVPKTVFHGTGLDVSTRVNDL